MIRKALAFGSDMTDTSPMSRPRAADRLGHAAFSQFVTVGADSLTMEGIAERAGVSIGAAYRWQPSLDEVVAQALRGALPALDQEIAAAESLDRWLQPRDLQDRLLTEALLAVRRFPSLSGIVRHALDTVGRGVEPLGLSVLVGTQAAMVAGCVLPSSARTALARLYERIRLTDPAGPLPWAPQAGGEFAANVEHVCAFSQHPLAMRESRAHIGVLSAVRKRIGCDVDDGHHLGPIQRHQKAAGAPMRKRR